MNIVKRYLPFLLFILVELVLFNSYHNSDANFHWFTHFFVGAIFALLIMTAFTTIRRRPSKLPLLWILLAHLFAMFPDIQFSISHVAHNENYDDYFLLHIHSHFIPGRNISWYILTMFSFGLYLTALHKVQDLQHKAIA